MFTVFEKNTVKCFEGFSRSPQSLLALSILICSLKIGKKNTIELCACARKGCRRLQTLFFDPYPSVFWGVLGPISNQVPAFLWSASRVRHIMAIDRDQTREICEKQEKVVTFTVQSLIVCQYPVDLLTFLELY